ncbi:hypothetical protein L6164_028527 [Bauhinia variegata]|uniref:Uncharacterized protein n=1 Tax=Bauhinia variegata TaxID=167791 RepID=A0ACB9L5Y0_BAUVA|nr:hypothetical protein L6164_028527 [Bauhinia variegata]
MADWDNRLMLELYLYDYLMKRNLHETAEIFRKESNLSLDPMTRPAIDIPEGFLLEWWRANFEFETFRAWMHENYTFEKVPSTKGKEILETKQGSNASQGGLYPNNEQINRQLPNNLACTMHRRWKSLEAVAVNGIDNESQGFVPSSYQKELLTCKSGICTPANATETKSQRKESSALASSKAAIAADNEEPDPVIENLLKSFWVFEQDAAELCEISMIGECSRNMKNLRKFEEGNTGMLKHAGFSSQSVHADDDDSLKSDASSSLQISSKPAD